MTKAQKQKKHKTKKQKEKHKKQSKEKQKQSKEKQKQSKEKQKTEKCQQVYLKKIKEAACRKGKSGLKNKIRIFYGNYLEIIISAVSGL